MSDLRGRWALVTGASSGLGADFARELAARGANVVLVARREAPMKSLAAALEGAHRVATHVVAMDLAAPDAPAALAARLRTEHLAVDVLVNNAGFGVYGPFLDIPWEREREMLLLDVVALVHLTKLFVRDMVARNFGYVLQVSSIGAYQPSPTYASYSAAKAGVHGFTKALALEVAKKNVTVNTISPGYIGTKMVTAIPKEVLDSKILPHIPVGRLGKPEEVAGLIIYLASEEAAFVTGANIAINGGQHMQ